MPLRIDTTQMETIKVGEVAWVKIYELKELPPIDEVIEAIRNLG